MGEVGEVSFPCVHDGIGETLPDTFVLDCFVDDFDTEFGLLVLLLLVFDEEEE